jgi:hypothetical protein
MQMNSSYLHMQSTSMHRGLLLAAMPPPPFLAAEQHKAAHISTKRKATLLEEYT